MKRMRRASPTQPLWNLIKLYLYISQPSHCQLEPCQVSHPPYNPPLGRLFPGKDDCEKKKAARIRRATRITGYQSLCFPEEWTMIDWLIKFRRSRDVWGSAETEAEADSDWHLVPQGTPHPCFSSLKVGLFTYNVNFPKEIKQINIQNCVVEVNVKGIIMTNVFRNGDQNWVSVSRTMKQLGEGGRPSDW